MVSSLWQARQTIPPEVVTLILESINEAYDDYYKHISDSSKSICSATTKANFINDHMIFHAREKLNGHPDIYFFLKNGRTHLLVCGRYELKFKKLNMSRRPSNILTGAVIDYNDQQINHPTQLAFPGMVNKAANLIAGYQQNKLKTGIEAVYIVCPDGSRNRWEWKLGFYEKPVEKITSLPTPDRPVKTVRPKRGVRDDEATQEQRGILQSRDANVSKTSQGNQPKGSS